MKNWLKKNWMFLGFLLSGLIDTKLGLLEKFISDPVYLNLVRLLGASALAWFWASPKNVKDISAKNSSVDDGLGGVVPGKGY